MRKFSSNLDELQEQKALRVERNGAWLAFWGLLAAILIQSAFGIGNMIGEWIVFMFLALYMAIDFLRKGIWSRSLQPTGKNNLLMSLIPATLLSILYLASSYVKYHSLGGSLATALIMFVSSFLLIYFALSLSLFAYKKKVAKLEQELPEDNDL